MNTIVDQTTVTGPDAALTIEKLLAEVDSVKPGHVTYVEPGEPFYQPPTDRVTKRASELKPSVDVLRHELGADIRQRHFFADIYRLDGTPFPIEERDEVWWASVEAHNNPGLPNGIQNSVVRLGADYLAVGRGDWAITGETTVDGEVAFEFEPYDRWVEHQMLLISQAEASETQAFLNAHPQIEAARPAWATRMTIDVDDEEAHVFYIADFGLIDVTVIGLITGDDIKLGAPKFGFYGELEDVSAHEIAQLIITASSSLDDAVTAVGATL